MNGNREYSETMVSAKDEKFLEDIAASRYAVGDENYREEVKQEILGKLLERAVTGDIKWPEDNMPGIEAVEQVVLAELGISRDDLHSHGGHAGAAKSLAVELSCRFSGKTQREVGKYYGYTGDGGVSKQRKRLALKMSADKELSVRFNKLTRSLSKYIVQV